MLSSADMTAALAIVFSLQGLLIILQGTLLAMITSFLPGIGGTGIAVLVMLATLGWSPEHALLMFSALTGGATFMGSITAILFRIPGNTPSAVSLLDGYPLAQRGYPRTAIACAATASALGSVFGVLLLLLVLPVAGMILDSIGSFELLLIGLWGLLLIAVLPARQPVYGMTMAALGLVLSAVGLDPGGESFRWTLGIDALESGIGLLPLLLGLFTLSEIALWLRKFDPQQSARQMTAAEDSIAAGFFAVLRHWRLTLRSAMTGTAVGMVPGIGGTAASFIAYAQAAAAPVTEANEASFGAGNIRGLIAPEAAIDAKDGGALLPAITLGLPGSEAGIVLIAVFSIHGITPGISMLTSDLQWTLLLVFGLLVSNLLTSILGVSLVPLLARIRSLPVERLAMPLLALSLLAILQVNGVISDLYVAVAFALFGYWLNRYNWPVVPLVVAFVLGGFVETNLTLSMQLIDAGRIDPFARAGSLTLMALIAGSVLLYGFRRSHTRRLADQVRVSTDSRQQRTSHEDDRVPAGMLLVIGLILLAGTLLSTAGSYSLYPVICLLLLLVFAGLSLRRAINQRESGRMKDAGVALHPDARQFASIGLLLCIPALLWLFGLVVGLALAAFAWYAYQSNFARLYRALLASLVYALLVWFYIDATALYLPAGRFWLWF